MTMNKNEIRNIAKLIAQLQEDFRFDGTDDRITPSLMQVYRAVVSDLLRNINNIKPINLEDIDERLKLY